MNTQERRKMEKLMGYSPFVEEYGAHDLCELTLMNTYDIYSKKYLESDLKDEAALNIHKICREEIMSRLIEHFVHFKAVDHYRRDIL